MENNNPDNNQNVDMCANCGASLRESEAVTRTYINKDADEHESGSDEVTALGHYEDGEFENDAFGGFGGGRYDLLDDSDTCTSCGGQL